MKTARLVLIVVLSLAALMALAGCGSGTAAPAPTPSTATAVTITASPTSVTSGGSSVLTVTATNASSVVVSNNLNNTTFNLAATGGTQSVTPTQTTTYTATATGTSGAVTATATVTVTGATAPAPTVTITANPTTVTSGASSVLTVAATNATTVVISNNLNSTTYSLAATGGTQSVTPTQTTTYTATATGTGGTVTAAATVTVTGTGTVTSINHVLFLMQENRTFDTYFGMLNPYRKANSFNVGDDGKEYDVDGIDDKLTKISNVNDEGAVFPLFKTKSTCLDDMSSAWLESYGDVSRYNFSPSRPILMDGFVHTAEGYAKSGVGSGVFTDLAGQRAMAYYDQGFLNYYYYMASQFALSDRWFSPVSTKTIPNRIATMTGGTTQGLVNDPANDDKLPQLGITTIFQELTTAGVSWKIYYSSTNDACEVDSSSCKPTTVDKFPSTTFSYFSYADNFLYMKTAAAPTCTGTTQDSGTAVGDPNNSFCIDLTKIAPVTQLFTDMANGALPSFAYIEAGYGDNDEHPGSGQSILVGQTQVSSIVDALMTSPSWVDSAFFLTYDEGGGPYDHVPPVPGSTNLNTDASLGVTTDISSIAVNPDSYKPCLPAVAGTPTTHCDLTAADPGATATDAPAVSGFKAQLGFRLPNIIISRYTRKHYVSHTPMDHTAVIKFVESRFIGPNANLTLRDAAQPNLLEFFDFTGIPWSTPPTPPAPVSDAGGATCTPTSM